MAKVYYFEHEVFGVDVVDESNGNDSELFGVNAVVELTAATRVNALVTTTCQ
jgi:hypothetical protein